MRKIRLTFLMVIVATGFSVSTYAAYAYKDNDNDGWASTFREITDAQIPGFIAKGWKVSPTKPPVFDCNDADATVWEKVQLWVDNDGDKYATGYEIHCVGNTLPPGRIRIADRLGSTDCNDANGTVWRSVRIFPDVDGDKWTGGVGNVVCIGVTPAGFVAVGDVLGYGDCNDNDAAVFQTVGLLFDNDGDNYVIINTPLTYLCIGATPPAKYILPANRLGISDCNDNNPAIWRGICLVPVDGIGKRTGPNVQSCIGGTVPAGFIPCVDYVAPAAELLEGVPAEEAFTVSVYPNPAVSRVFITPDREMNTKVEVKLMDPYGRVVKMVSSPNLFKGQNLSMAVGDLKPGIYRITIQSGDAIVSRTIAVKL